MVAFFWVGTPQKGMKIIKFGRHLVEGISTFSSLTEAPERLTATRMDYGIGEHGI